MHSITILCPQNNETGGIRRPAKTKKGNRYLKAILTQCVNAFSRSKNTSRLVSRFHSLKIRRGHNKAVMAVCRSLLMAIYHILSNDQPFREMSEPLAYWQSVGNTLFKRRGLRIKLSVFYDPW
ncbi:MAG: transposase [Desulfitobacteriaceae bacterium]